MTLPSAERVVDALRKHPDLYEEVVEIITSLEDSEPVPYKYKTVLWASVNKMTHQGWRVVSSHITANGTAMYVMERRKQ